MNPDGSWMKQLEIAYCVVVGSTKTRRNTSIASPVLVTWARLARGRPCRLTAVKVSLSYKTNSDYMTNDTHVKSEYGSGPGQGTPVKYEITDGRCVSPPGNL